ncbi:hypothetical protein VST7929_01304 [Vibrio stylophorae]|uniref:Uncharacterized protein n=1 Tax=Vibrio stylophorae TaxID=659351 RepID=A0ABN8DQI4_9VIBR|nr:hypothetical protein VST7929_01304 [Vibrio stylophorae]
MHLFSKNTRVLLRRNDAHKKTLAEARVLKESRSEIISSRFSLFALQLQLLLRLQDMVRSVRTP